MTTATRFHHMSEMNNKEALRREGFRIAKRLETLRQVVKNPGQYDDVDAAKDAIDALELRLNEIRTELDE